MACRFCFAKYRTKRSEYLCVEDAKSAIEQAASLGIKKINFAGGEPLLYPHLSELIAHTATQGVTTSIVTNGSLLTPEWINLHFDTLNCIGVSIDSIHPDSNLRAGRAVNGRIPIEESEYRNIAGWVHEAGIELKVNTVVSRYNAKDDMNEFLIAIAPQRWKIFMALVLEGVNSRRAKSFSISINKLREFTEAHRKAMTHIPTFVEDNRLMTSSYLMMDPKGRLYDNTSGGLSYSEPVSKIGLKKALSQVYWSLDRFEERSKPLVSF
jgi:radical S-adenosyl methionine domain-containing protein 2